MVVLRCVQKLLQKLVKDVKTALFVFKHVDKKKMLFILQNKKKTDDF